MRANRQKAVFNYGSIHMNENCNSNILKNKDKFVKYIMENARQSLICEGITIDIKIWQELVLKEVNSLCKK